MALLAKIYISNRRSDHVANLNILTGIKLLLVRRIVFLLELMRFKVLAASIPYLVKQAGGLVPFVHWCFAKLDYAEENKMVAPQRIEGLTILLPEFCQRYEKVQRHEHQHMISLYDSLLWCR
jgi:hypothetical protein